MYHPPVRAIRLPFLGVLCLCWVGSLGAEQMEDAGYQPRIEQPSFKPGSGPKVAVDAGHHNFHTIDGRYRPFAAVLKADGFQVRPVKEVFSEKALENTDVLVIANALHESNEGKWSLPTPSAFSSEEIDAVVSWVEEGGGLLLIADHMPFPGAAGDLSARFGVEMRNGFALGANPGNPTQLRGGPTIFRREDGGIADHPITVDRGDIPGVRQVATFTGQALELKGGASPLLVFRQPTVLLEPSEAWKFTGTTPREEVTGWPQAATVHHGRGRVAVFGEAAMFTAQRMADGQLSGMATPEAKDNQLLLRNTLCWLAGRGPAGADVPPASRQ